MDARTTTAAIAIAVAPYHSNRMKGPAIRNAKMGWALPISHTISMA